MRYIRRYIECQDGWMILSRLAEWLGEGKNDQVIAALQVIPLPLLPPKVKAEMMRTLPDVPHLPQVTAREDRYIPTGDKNESRRIQTVASFVRGFRDEVADAGEAHARRRCECRSYLGLTKPLKHIVKRCRNRYGEQPVTFGSDGRRHIMRYGSTIHVIERCPDAPEEHGEARTW